ncbi:WD domain containing protein, partial [Entamoeba invadens IP1]
FGEKQNTCPYKTISVGPDVTSACVHEEAPYFAVGTVNNHVKVFNVITGEVWQHVKMYENFLRIKSTAASFVTFPSYDFGLAVVAGNSVVMYSLN